MRLQFGSFALAIGLLAIAVMAGQAQAQSRYLTAQEISELLTNNTATGKWNGTEYRQFFGEDGNTIYATRQSQSSLGQWRTRKGRFAFASLWNEGTWASFAVVRTNKTLHWLSETGDEYPFAMVSGQQLLWPQP